MPQDKKSRKNIDPMTGKPYSLKAPKEGVGLFGNAARAKEKRKKMLEAVEDDY